MSSGADSARPLRPDGAATGAAIGSAPASTPLRHGLPAIRRSCAVTAGATDYFQPVSADRGWLSICSYSGRRGGDMNSNIASPLLHGGYGSDAGRHSVCTGAAVERQRLGSGDDAERLCGSRVRTGRWISDGGRVDWLATDTNHRHRGQRIVDRRRPDELVRRRAETAGHRRARVRCRTVR